MVAQITISVANVDNLISTGFNDIEILKQTESGSYTPITVPDSIGARLYTTPATTFYKIGGTTVGLSVDGAPEVLVTFSSVLMYWSPAQVAARINEVLPDLASTVENKVKLQSLSSGRGSTLETTYSTATALGLTVGFRSIGLDDNIPLVNASYVYPYTDPSGSVGDSYKWRFSNGGEAPISELHGPILGGEVVVSGVNVSIGTATFVGLDGRPRKSSIIVVSDRPPTVMGVVAVGNERPVIYTSDDSGFLQVPLVQGAVVRIAIEGTAYVREITVPATDTFDILHAMSTAPDPFTVQTTPPYLIRRSI